MKKIFGIILVFFLTFSHTFALTIDTGSSSTDKIWVMATLEKINKSKSSLSEIEAQINFEKQKEISQSKLIGTLESLHQKIQNEENNILTLQALMPKDAPVWVEQIKTLNTAKDTFSIDIQEYLTAIEYSNANEIKDYNSYIQNKRDIEKKYSETLKKLSAEIIDSEKFLVNSQDTVNSAQEEIRKSQIELQIEVKDLVTKLLIFIGSFFFLLFSSKLLQKSIRSKESFSEEKKQVLLSIVKWTKNLFLFMLIVFFFFSEFITILPFLAILWTALWFALRDVISSFIAWFVIGLKDGIYGVGDVIEIEEDNVFWRIIKITPLITVIQELGLSGPNGMYRSFPNKKIFERSIKNVWKQKGWIFISTDFLMEAKSDITLAKKTLLETMKEVSTQEKFSQPMSQKSFLKKFGHTEETLKPQVFLEIRPQWVLLRGKVPVIWGERHQMRSEIVEKFIDKVRKNKAIVFRYVEIGGNFMSGKI